MIPHPPRRAAGSAALAFLVLLVAGGASAGAATAEAEAMVQDTVDRVMAILRDDGLDDPAKREKLESIAFDRFDWDTIGKLVLGRNRSRLTDAQREEFVAEFKRHLSLSYGENLSDYGDEEVEVDGSRAAPGGDVTVRTKIRNGSEPVVVDYRLRRQSSDWKVIDVVVENVSLVLNFRNQVQEIINDVGVEQLIDTLRQKNAARTETS